MLIQCRNCKIIWLIMTDKDTTVSDGLSFSTDLFLSIIKLLSTTSLKRKYVRFPN